MALPFTKQWREERRKTRDAQRETLLKAANERDLNARIAAASAAADAAEKRLSETAKDSREWTTRNQEWIEAQGALEKAKLELATFKTNQSFNAIKDIGKHSG
jgi:hypothetical protein